MVYYYSPPLCSALLLPVSLFKEESFPKIAFSQSRLQFVPSSTIKGFSTAAYQIKIFKKTLKRSNFKRYRLSTSTAQIQAIWVVAINSLSYSCFPFLKRGNCKHVLNMQIPLKLVTVPSEAKWELLGQKRKCGWSKQASCVLPHD